jgi:hypothetical protein
VLPGIAAAASQPIQAGSMLAAVWATALLDDGRHGHPDAIRRIELSTTSAAMAAATAAGVAGCGVSNLVALDEQPAGARSTGAPLMP